MARKERIEHHVSAGGVVYRQACGGVEIALCHRVSPPLWALPKGTPDKGESMDQTALREVREETGLEVEIRSSLGSIEYWFVRSQDRVRCHKTVHFYLMVTTGGDFSCHDPEFDDVHWWPEAEALNIMTHSNEVELVKKALRIAHDRAVPG